MLYAKFLNEQEVEMAPKELLINARKYVGFTKDFMTSQGFKPIRHLFISHAGNNPDSDKYEMFYVDKGEYIEQDWRLVEEEEES